VDKTMAVPPTPDNPHGWGYIEKRKSLEHYQLSPRVQIVVGDIIKVSKGTYWVNRDGVKVSLDTMRGEWKVIGIFDGEDGMEMDIIHCWPGGLFGSKTTIRVSGDEYPSPVVDTIIRRPYKVRLAAPKFKRKRRQKKVDKPAPKKVEKVEEDIDWDAIKNIVGDIEDE
tara:strand:- start:400 stop:903 length:504 start_codon:yes stop_codon:yes gene_type:complete